MYFERFYKCKDTSQYFQWMEDRDIKTFLRQVCGSLTSPCINQTIQPILDSFLACDPFEHDSIQPVCPCLRVCRWYAEFRMGLLFRQTDLWCRFSINIWNDEFILKRQVIGLEFSCTLFVVVYHAKLRQFSVLINPLDLRFHNFMYFSYKKT